MLDETYTAIRTINFVWSFALFFGMIYWGIVDIMLDRQCHVEHANRERNAWATATLAASVVLILSLSEVFLRSVAGGFRVPAPLLFLAAATYAFIKAVSRVRKHRTDVRNGACK